jgi:hypothetical protein
MPFRPILRGCSASMKCMSYDSETTYREVSDRFAAEAMTPPIPVKGLDEPIPIYRILGLAQK